MSCGNPHETDCREVLDHLYEYLDNEMPDGDYAKFKEHFDECHPCLEKYGLEQAVKKLVKRCCGSDEVPIDLRGKVMGRIEAIRAGELGPLEEKAERSPQAGPAQAPFGAAAPDPLEGAATPVGKRSASGFGA
jgi:anti-sigma factor (TIGR02949 family)